MSSRFGDRTTGGQTPTAGNRSFGASKRFGGKSNYTRRENQLTAQEALEIDKKKALEPFEPEKLPPTFMYVSVAGIIQSGSVSLVIKSSLLTLKDEGFNVRQNEV